MRRAALAAMLALVGLCQTPAPAEDAGLGADFAALQRQDAWLQQVGYRLATTNAPFCAHTRYAGGLLLQDAAAYGDPAAIRRLLGLKGDIFAQAVVPGSPADAAGIRPGDEITALNGRPLANWPWSASEPWRRLVELGHALDGALTGGGTAVLARAAPAPPAELHGTAACAARFELLSHGEGASASAERVAIGRDFTGLGYPEAEFAAAVAHELAHVVLSHYAWLEQHGRSSAHVRLTEREADRLMPWLLANAGYDPAAAARLLAKWQPRDGGGFLRRRSHDPWQDRVRSVSAELPQIAAARTGGTLADWRKLFRREIAD